MIRLRFAHIGMMGMLGLLALSAPAAAAEWKGSYTPELRYAIVDGYVDKFEAQHWMNAGIDGGITEFELKNANVGGFEVSSEGHFLPGNADYFYELLAKKEDAMYLDFGFSQFRKYFDALGGVHLYGEPLRNVSSGRDLFVDIGKLELEFGLTPPNLPDLALIYEYEYKVGTKSRTTWSAIAQGGRSLKTGPVWQEIDEEVHVFELKADDNWNGLIWKADQKWERFTNYSVREERDISVASTASANKVRDHILEPRSDLFTSVIELKHWLWKDKALAGAGYRYTQIENSEVETILEMDTNKIPTTFANPHQVAPSQSTNQFGSHTGILSFFLAPAKEWTFGLKGKAEEIKKNGQSTLENDNAGAAPDGNIDRYDVSNTDSRLLRFGESLTVRYTGIPNLSLYNDVEFEQIDNELVESRTSSSAGEIFARETFNNVYRGVNEIGFNYRPNDFLLWAGQYRVLQDNIDFDDQFETIPTATGAKSAFMDAQRNQKNEIATRTTLNFCEWFSPTMRYQYQDHGYTFRVDAVDLDVRSDSISHTFTVDLPLKTIPELMMTTSFQYQDTVSKTPAADAEPLRHEAFHGDVSTWSLNAGYLINKDITLTGTAQYQWADNQMELSSTYIPFAADYDKVDLGIGLDWRLNKTMMLEPRYDYYHYGPDEDVEFGEYDAHVVWLGLSVEWA